MVLSQIIAFALGLNLPRSVLLAAAALSISTAVLFLKNSRTHQPTLIRRLKGGFQKSWFALDETQVTLILLLIFGALVTRASFAGETSQAITTVLEYLFIIPSCISVAASPINRKTQRSLSRMAIAYSAGSVIYVAACLLNTRLHGDFSLPSLIFRQAHNEIYAPWGHLKNIVNIRTVEQSLLFPISLLPISLVTFFVNKNWRLSLLPVLIGTAALLMSRGFGSHFPLSVLLISSSFSVASIVSAKRPARTLITQHKKGVMISAAAIMIAAACITILIKRCFFIDERLPRAIAAIRHLPLLNQQNGNLTFQYFDSCVDRQVTFISAAGDSLHNVFLNYSLQAGSAAGITLFACTLLLSLSFFTGYYQLLKSSTKESIDNLHHHGIIASTISTIWLLWLFQPMESANFSMFILSLYFLASSASNASLNPPQNRGN